MAKILIFGLSGSGKTTLADELAKCVGYARLNADKIRAEENDWDFSAVGRTRQAQRMAEKAKQFDNVVIDTIAPLKLHRAIIKADFLIWMNTVLNSKYSNTDKLFEPPKNADIVITDFNYSVYDVIHRLTTSLNSGN